MAELYRVGDMRVEEGRAVRPLWPVGYTEDEVRRLADTVRNFHERSFSEQQAALAPFRALLDGGPDAKA